MFNSSTKSIKLKVLTVLFTAFLVFVLGSAQDVLGRGPFLGGFNTNPPTTVGPFPKAGVAAIYWESFTGSSYNVFITIKHNGITYPEMDTSTFIPAGSSGLEFGFTGIEVAAGDFIEMRVRDNWQPTSDPPPWWSRGWALPGTTGGGGSQSADLCGWDPYSKKNIAAERNYVSSIGEPIVSPQCWGDWDPPSEGFDANDALLIVSYDPNDNPKGFHDGDSGSSAQCQVVGWACDQDRYTQPLSIHIYEGSTFLASTLANIPAEAGVAAACGGNADHRFSYTFPSASPIWDGNPHTISAYAINIDGAGNPAGSNPLLTNSPRTMTCVASGADPWVQTKFGDVHANNSINFSASRPSGEDNASYIISARSSIVGSSEANWIAQYYPEGEPDWTLNTPVSAPSYETLWERFGGDAASYPPSGSALPSGNGTYLIDGNKTVSSIYNQDSGAKTLIFIKGNLTINAEIRVPSNSVIVFIVSGNIRFSKRFSGGGPSDDFASGIYIAEGWIDTAYNYDPGEVSPWKLYIEGALISLKDTVLLNRTLSPANNATTPAELISLPGKYYVLLKSALLGQPKFYYREVPAGF